LPIECIEKRPLVPFLKGLIARKLEEADMIIKTTDKLPKLSLKMLPSLGLQSRYIIDHYNTVEGRLTYPIQCSNLFSII